MCLTLDAKLKRFIGEYLIDGNGTRAASAAGYAAGASAAVTARRLLKRPDVAAEIEARRTKDRERLRIDRQTVLDGLVKAIAQARLQEDPGAQISGWKEIAKMLGLYAPAEARMSLSGPLGARLQALGAKSDAELLALIQNGSSELDAAFDPSHLSNLEVVSSS